MSEPTIQIFTMEHCPYCVKAKQLLKQKNISYNETLIDEDDDAQWEALEKRSGMQTVPQIFFGEKLIGGYTELAALDQKDGLKSLKS